MTARARQDNSVNRSKYRKPGGCTCQQKNLSIGLGEADSRIDQIVAADGSRRTFPESDT